MLAPRAQVADLALGSTCHLVNQKGWRNHPGHDAQGAFHLDELFVELPEALASDPRYKPPILIITALIYLCDVDEDLCPTWVIPYSFRSGRRPNKAERSWNGHEVVSVPSLSQCAFPLPVCLPSPNVYHCP